MDFTIVILAGYAGAGKSTIARSLSGRSGLGFVDHQKVLHDIAASKGFDRSRYWLEEVGFEEFTRESTRKLIELTAQVKSGGGRGVILDAAYGTLMVKEFRDKFPDSKLLIGEVIAGQEIRAERIGHRMGGVNKESAASEMRFRDDFLDSVGLEQVLPLVDFRIENKVNGNLDEVVLDIETKLKGLGVGMV
jgi:cytidylate kinase